MSLIHHFVFTNTSSSLFPLSLFWLNCPPLLALVLCPTGPTLNVSVVYLQVSKLTFTSYHGDDCEIRLAGLKQYKPAT